MLGMLKRIKGEEMKGLCVCTVDLAPLLESDTG